MSNRGFDDIDRVNAIIKGLEKIMSDIANGNSDAFPEIDVGNTSDDPLPPGQIQLSYQNCAVNEDGKVTCEQTKEDTFNLISDAGEAGAKDAVVATTNDKVDLDKVDLDKVDWKSLTTPAKLYDFLMKTYVTQIEPMLNKLNTYITVTNIPAVGSKAATIYNNLMKKNKGVIPGKDQERFNTIYNATTTNGILELLKKADNPDNYNKPRAFVELLKLANPSN